MTEELQTADGTFRVSIFPFLHGKHFHTLGIPICGVELISYCNSCNDVTNEEARAETQSTLRHAYLSVDTGIR